MKCCKDCEYVTDVQRKYGVTHHCSIECTNMDVSFYFSHGGKSAFCPLDKPQPVVIVGYGVGHCPRCMSDVHGRGMITQCPKCGQALTWERHRHVKDSTELSGGHLW